MKIHFGNSENRWHMMSEYMYYAIVKLFSNIANQFGDTHLLLGDKYNVDISEGNVDVDMLSDSYRTCLVCKDFDPDNESIKSVQTLFTIVLTENILVVMCNKVENKATIAIRPPEDDEGDDADFIVKFEDRKDFSSDDAYAPYKYILDEVMKVIVDIFNVSRPGDCNE